MRRLRQVGFTLIELMIVIAIIGILAAIAIPNFISYRNKSFCASVESDANAIAGAVADYFSISVHTVTPTSGNLNGGSGITLTGTNTGTITGSDPGINITITVTDGSGVRFGAVLSDADRIPAQPAATILTSATVSNTLMFVALLIIRVSHNIYII